MRRIYFDYAASTPVDPRVEAAMRPYFSEKFGNASSLHSFGQEALAAVDNARETIAKAIGRPPAGGFREIIFTGSATEANNLALRGVINATRKTRISLELSEKNHSSHSGVFVDSGRVRMIVSSIEHESILETARDLENEGRTEVVYLPVDKSGLIDLEELKKSLTENTILVSVMYANNEIGTIQPVAEISKIISEFRKQKIENRNTKNSIFYFLNSKFYPLFHTDAVQAFQYLDCDVNKLGVDLMTLSGHKIYGPKGSGALYIRPIGLISPIGPIVTGGGQEFGLRSGTENVPAIVGFGKAVELATAVREKEVKRVGKLRDYFWQGLKKVYPKAEINGAATRKIRTSSELPEKNKNHSGHSDAFARPPSSCRRQVGQVDSDCLPNILNVYFPDYRADELLTRFDLVGLAVSAGSACSSRSAEPSYIIRALGHDNERAKRSLRFSFGRPTTRKDIDKALKIIRGLI